jgi:hypothetical protein
MSERTFFFRLMTGILFFGASLLAVFASARYATVAASNPVEDVILSNTPVFNVEWLFVYGAFAAVIFTIIMVLWYKLPAAPFILRAGALFLFIRSLFVSLTHVSPYPYRLTMSHEFLSSVKITQMFFTGDDLFFSGHVGLTYLMALLLWDDPILRRVYIGISIVFSIVVLLGHLHYSIDVLAAYFITYTIFIMATKLFRKDYLRAEHGY